MLMPQSTSVAPGYTSYRAGITTNDDIAALGTEQGLQTEDYEYANFVVVPSGGANPSASIYYWNETEEAWVLDVDFTAVTGAGVNTPYAFSAKVLGRLVLVVLSSLSAGSVDINANSFGFSNRI